MKAVIINGSPRKNGNTVSLLNKVIEGLNDSACETKTVHLRDLKFTGCLSCLACKVKGNKTNGLCALRDELRPILEEILDNMRKDHFEEYQRQAYELGQRLAEKCRNQENKN